MTYPLPSPSAKGAAGAHPEGDERSFLISKWEAPTKSKLMHLRLHQLVQLAEHVNPDFEPTELASLTKKDIVTQLLFLKVSAFRSSPRTRTHSAGTNDPEVHRLPVLMHCCCSHGISEANVNGNG